MGEYIQTSVVDSSGIKPNRLKDVNLLDSFKVKITAGDGEEDFMLAKLVFGEGLSGTEEYDENGKGIIRIEREALPQDRSNLAVDISASEWLNMYTTGKSVLPALTGTKYYELYDLALTMIYNSIPYSYSGYYINQLLKDSIDNRIVMTNNTNMYAGKTFNCMSFLRNVQGSDGFPLPLNAGLYIKHSEQGMANGNSNFKLRGTYRIIDLST